MNPCPCGRGRDNGCTCSERQARQYWHKISGPILDRIDLWIPVSKIDYHQLAMDKISTEDSATVRRRVEYTRIRQTQRCADAGIRPCSNGDMSNEHIKRCALLTEEGRGALRLSAERLGLSARSFYRTIKVARTIADMAESHHITKEHILEALQYRPPSHP